MSEYNIEDIKNLHYNNVNEIQYEYGGQIYHCRMEHLKEILVTCWNLQQENKQLQNNWNELKKGLQSLFEFDYGVISKDYLECAEDTLEKMQELEGNNE